MAHQKPEGIQERFLKHKGMSHVYEHLKGTELMDIDVEDDTWQGFCDAVCRKFFDESKFFKEPLHSLVDLPREDHPLFLRATGPTTITRLETTNWKHARHNSKPNIAAACRDELTSLLTKHLGEARTWNCPEDSWVTVPREEATQWKNGVQVAASGAESDSLFSPHRQIFEECLDSGAMPDLANPLSTLVCPQVDDPDTVCLRSVKAVTLAAVLHHYKDDFLLHELRKTWLAGRVVVRARSGAAPISPPHIPSPPSSLILCF